jgi:FlaA1/EpsC-like NDP-sugar epimerase
MKGFNSQKSNKILERSVNMTYKQRLPLFLLSDSCIVITAFFISLFLVNQSLDISTISIKTTGVVMLLSYHLFSLKFKWYKKSWKYAGVQELLILLEVVSFSILVTIIMAQFFFNEVYFRLLIVSGLLNIFFLGGSRLGLKLFRSPYYSQDRNKKTLIVGAGSAGTIVAGLLMKNNEVEFLPVGFIDDDFKKQGLEIMGIPVLGGIKEIERIVSIYKVENIVIAIPSLKRKELNKIFQECAKTNAKTQILPMIEDLVSGKISVNQFRDVQVEDLLGRDLNKLDIDGISGYMKGKTVLVTGAGGSIGSEICRQITPFNPKRLIMLGHGENSIYSIEMDLKERYPDFPIEFITEIADLQDVNKMELVMRTYKPDVVYHAAAHKHVPLMERNPEEAVKNNIIGTMNVAKAASWNNVKTFVMISTDKAVNPTSVMGSTKRLAEMMIQEMNNKSQTKFVAVRFGNVLGSRGSVIPLFKKQIEKGGPVTVTHPEMVRYFMTIPEASRLVIQAGALANGGEIFVLDMGEPVKIVDLAKNLIKLSGNSIDDIGIEFTGMRPGEKLFEELLNEEEIHEQQIFPKIYIGKTSELYIKEIEDLIATYETKDRDELRKQLLMIANGKVAPSSKILKMV